MIQAAMFRESTPAMLRLIAIPILLLISGPVHAQSSSTRGNGQVTSINCGGGDVLIEGSRNTATIRGACRALILRGDANRVAIELAPSAEIRVEGQGNRVTWTLARAGSPPAVSVSGQDSLVVPASKAARSTDQLALRGDDLQLQEDCAGRDVLIEGLRSNLRLLGGCRSVTLRGELAVVQAELQPGSRVLIEGGGNLVAYALTRQGATPTVTIRGEASRARRVTRLAP